MGLNSHLKGFVWNASWDFKGKVRFVNKNMHSMKLKIWIIHISWKVDGILIEFGGSDGPTLIDKIIWCLR